MKIDISRCARCRLDHEQLEFSKLTYGQSEWTHYSLCPTNNEPIMLSVVDPVIIGKSIQDKWVVRLYDSFDHRWYDCTDALPMEEAQTIWFEKTGSGTKNTRYKDMSYYAICAADTRMVVNSLDDVNTEVL